MDYDGYSWHNQAVYFICAVAMVNESLNKSVPEALRADILETMLDLYQNNIAEHSVFFKGMSDTLNAIEAQGLKWA